MTRRWIAWGLATVIAVVPFALWPFALVAIVAVVLPLQLAASIRVARGRSATTLGRVGWSIGLMLASMVLCAATLFVWYVKFGESFGR
jgi:hypothetical protein